MTELINAAALDALVNSRLPRECFGPGSDHPYLAIDLVASDPVHAPWLSDLPCPMIGIGDGPLADACDVVMGSDDDLTLIVANITRSPITAMILVQHLRASETLSLTDALTAESFAYAAVQKGPEFQHWLSENPNVGKTVTTPAQPVLVDINNHHLHLEMNDPENRNAIGVAMRDGLCEALDLALNDPQISKISLSGAGRCFSTGGAVDEFGEIADPATAHWVRSLRLPAWRLARLQDKLQVHVDGAAIGAGAEIAAFGQHVTATDNAWFQLPELKYGLIPGAGGTASLTRRIGRQKTAYMALSMKRMNAQSALAWGLVDDIIS